MRNISKNIFLNALTCPTLGWLLRNEDIADETPQLEPTLGERFRIEQGIEIGNRARSLYPNGLLIDEARIASAVAKTEKATGDRSISTIFEGAFLTSGFAARPDILKRSGNRWHLVEVKSSVNDKEEFIDDMAYTAMVIDHSVLDISKVSLLLVSKDFRLGMNNRDLFMEVDHTVEVLLRMHDFQPWWQRVDEITSASSKPEAQLQFECRKCQLFGHCLGKDITNHVFDIPRLSQSKFDKLMEFGIICIEDISNGFPLTENQSIVRDSVQTKKLFVRNTLADELSLVLWPAYYLDFETVMTAIPLYPEIAPYTQIPTQYSVHKCTDVGDIVGHVEYLADPAKDCRLDLAESLINDLQGEGSIIVYSNFEKTVINGLARLYPHLASQLNFLIDRIVDLEAIIRKNFYHPDFHGSTSIKRTLPTLVPDMSYDALPIAEGDSAMAAFAYLALGEYEDEEVKSVKQNLLDYCKQDTLAMVRLHERLAEFA